MTSTPQAATAVTDEMVEKALTAIFHDWPRYARENTGYADWCAQWRKDIRAALEAATIARHDARVAELEAENARLRAEIEKLQNVKKRANDHISTAWVLLNEPRAALGRAETEGR